MRRASTIPLTISSRAASRAALTGSRFDEHERGLQERLLAGPPPLGPGAPPGARLAAFYAAMVELLERHGHLALGAETGRSRFATGAYGFWRAHVRALVVAGGKAGPDALADLLLAPIAPEVYEFQRHQRGLAPGQIAAALTGIARALLG